MGGEKCGADQGGEQKPVGQGGHGCFFHGNGVKAGVQPAVFYVGFLENFSQVALNLAHVNTPQNRSGPRSARQVLVCEA